MASLDARTVELIAASGRVYSGLEQQQQRFCGVTLSDEALSFTTAFHEIQPDDPVGCIHLDAVVNAGDGQSCWRLGHLDVPANIVDYEILLFSSSCGTGGAQCKAIEVQ
ncbi:hypothetical protein BBJ28_00003560 [Nothophytophthora sp. Chile5]|nr:hypothetical protein BBJ28_00003560 [Nothophytophthora sp. Chile5]